MIHWKDGVRVIASILKYRCPREPSIAVVRNKCVQLKRESGMYDEERKTYEKICSPAFAPRTALVAYLST